MNFSIFYSYIWLNYFNVVFYWVLKGIQITNLHQKEKENLLREKISTEKYIIAKLLPATVLIEVQQCVYF